MTCDSGIALLGIAALVILGGNVWYWHAQARQLQAQVDSLTRRLREAQP